MRKENRRHIISCKLIKFYDIESSDLIKDVEKKKSREIMVYI